jgi:hypothetical protein
MSGLQSSPLAALYLAARIEQLNRGRVVVDGLAPKNIVSLHLA